MTRRALDLIRGLVALVATLAVLTAIPLGLVRWIGNPLPTTIPTLDEISLALRSGLNPDLVINIVAIVVWFTWAQLVIALAIETVAVVRHNRAHRLPLLPGLQQFAARTVATIALVASTLGPARGPAAFATTGPPVAVHETTHTLVIDQRAIDAPPAETTAPAPTQDAGNGHVSYTTQRFDTLWDIAERSLGDPTRWKDIQNLNTGRTMPDGTTFTADTHHLTAGWVLHLPADATLDETDDAADRTVEVQKGDDFWSLAQSALAEAWGRQPTSAETTPYWQQLVDANRDRLAPPHDPDLIYPGQEFILPPTPPDPEAASGIDRTGAPVTVDGEVVVDRGDHFWGIATRTLATEWDRQPTDAEVAGYWQSLINLNQERLRPPHNPDLIYPGQVFTLPDIPTDPDTGEASPMPDEASSTPTTDADPVPEGGPGTTSATTAAPTNTTEPIPPTVAAEQPGAGRDPMPLDINTDNLEDEGELDDFDDFVDEEPARGGLLPMAAKVAGLGILAASVMALLNRLRLVQLRRRRPGTIPTPPPDSALPVETTLRVAATPTALNLVDYALRSITPHIADNHLPEPDIFGAQISNDGLRLLLWTPHDQPPPGWDTSASGKEWFLPATTNLEHLRQTGAGVYASWPAFITLGHHDTTQVLVNLEHLGAIQVTGDADDVRDTFATIAVELAVSPIADTMTIYCIGFGHDLAHLERIQPADDLSDVLSDIEPVLDAVHAAPDTTVIDGRTQAGADLWEPIVVLDPSPTPPAQANRLLTAALSRSPISAAVAYPTGDRWKLNIDKQTVQLEPLGITLDRRNLTPNEQAGIAELTAAAQDLDGHPHLDLTQIDLFGPTDTEPPANGAEESSPSTSDGEEPAADRDTAASPAVATDADGTSTEASSTETAPRVTVTGGQEHRYDVRVLGPVRIEGLDGGFPRDTCREVVTYLATHPRGTTADALHEAIWPDQSPTRRIVRYLYDARRTLGTTPDGKLYVPKAGPDGRYRLHPDIGCDLNRFEAYIREATAAPNTHEETEHMKAALALVEGPPFSGVSSGYDWAYTEGFISQATVAIDDTAHHLAEHALTNNDPDTATWAARKGILVTRACEHCYRNLMKVGIAANNPVAVEAAYRELVAVTEADEGPHSTHLLAPETIALYEQHHRRRPESRRQRRGGQPGAA